MSRMSYIAGSAKRPLTRTASRVTRMSPFRAVTDTGTAQSIQGGMVILVVISCSGSSSILESGDPAADYLCISICLMEQAVGV